MTDLTKLRALCEAASEGPWEYVPSTEHHGPYVAGPLSGDICDCYVMSQPHALSTANGGPSKPIHHQHEEADANANLIATARTALPDLIDEVETLRSALDEIVNPLQYAKKRADEAGDRLSSMAHQVCNDTEYLRDIARAALSGEKP